MCFFFCCGHWKWVRFTKFQRSQIGLQITGSCEVAVNNFYFQNMIQRVDNKQNHFRKSNFILIGSLDRSTRSPTNLTSSLLVTGVVLKLSITLTIITLSSSKANRCPMQFLMPAEKAMKAKLFLVAQFSGKNRSRSNFSGSGNILRSRWMSKMWMWRVVPFGCVKPLRIQSSENFRPMNGTGG